MGVPARTGVAGCLSWSAGPHEPRSVVGGGVDALGLGLAPLPQGRALRARGAGLYAGPLYNTSSLRSAGLGLAYGAPSSASSSEQAYGAAPLSPPSAASVSPQRAP